MRGRGVAYTHLIPVLTYEFDENAFLGHVCWGVRGGLKKKDPGYQDPNILHVCDVCVTCDL